tara:strand:- start:177 stop:719 length:543 start_codon:yes stop_codon:yes gene_type:complete
MASLNLKDRYKNEVIKKLQSEYDYKNIMSVPKIEKVIISRGLGEAVTNSKVVEHSILQLKQITGQKPNIRNSKKSISNFKLREGIPNGVMVTMRGKNMWLFLNKLINIATPRIRDFRGYPKKFDGSGNYNLGIKEDVIFPETDGDVDKIRGFNITIVTSAKTDKEAYSLLEFIGFPFRVQ